MRIRFKLLFLMLFILLLAACSGDKNLPMDGEYKAKDYFQKYYRTDTSKLKVDFIDVEDFDKLMEQDNKFIVVASSIQCEYCKLIIPNFTKLLEEYSLEHFYFVKFEELNKQERNQIAKNFDKAILPTILFFNNGKISQYQGDFNIQEISDKIEEFIKD